MKKNTTIKIFAFLALFWIIASIIWTWILIFFWGNWEITWNNYEITTENTLTSEDLQKIIDDKITNSGTKLK